MSTANQPLGKGRAVPDFPLARDDEVRPSGHDLLKIPQDRNSNAGEGLLDYAAAARYLCTTPRHVRELWAKRCLAAVKVGRHVRFTRADLDVFINSRRVDALH